MFRSLLFFLYIFISNFFLFILNFWLLFFGRSGAFIILYLWSINCVQSAKYILRIDYEVRGEIPENPAIYASKHQSTWETAFLLLIIRKPIYILKRELFFTPIYGLVLKRAGNIGVKRSRAGAALKEMIRDTKLRIAQGHSVIIFPEGTRTEPGAKPNYKPGIAMLYKSLPDTPIIPISLNSGKCWGRYKFIKKPGLITVTFHQPLPKALSRNEFMKQLETTIEAN